MRHQLTKAVDSIANLTRAEKAESEWMMAKKNERQYVVTAAHEPVAENVITEAIRQQVAVVSEIELRSNFEKLKLGAIVSEAVSRLKLDGIAERGPGVKGGGALGWWNEVCPKDDAGAPVIAYRTVMMWKQAAENLPALMGKGARESGKLLSLMAKDPEEAVGKDAKILASAEIAANGMTMRQMLLWGGEEEKRKPGRPAGGVVEYRKKSSLECAVEAVWPTVQHLLKHRGEMFTAYKILPDDKLREIQDTLGEHLKAIDVVLAGRS